VTRANYSHLLKRFDALEAGQAKILQLLEVVVAQIARPRTVRRRMNAARDEWAGALRAKGLKWPAIAAELLKVAPKRRWAVAGYRALAEANRQHARRQRLALKSAIGS
jgi:hypothetical protein